LSPKGLGPPGSLGFFNWQENLEEFNPLPATLALSMGAVAFYTEPEAFPRSTTGTSPQLAEGVLNFA